MEAIPMMIEFKEKKKLITGLNHALGWELRAYAMYAHYAAYVKGLEGLTLKSHFEEEASESIGHAGKVRELLALLDAEAVTSRDTTPIVHTEDFHVMLDEALKTEEAAARHYQKLLPLAKDHPVFTHTLMHIYMAELNAVEEAKALMNK
jgi:bacterioferritin (cytochrome b1)